MTTTAQALEALRDALPKVGEPENVWCTVHASTIRAVIQHIESIAAEIARLQAECENLRSVMIAAAEEIHEYWDAHCDAEGYGPANLMRRLEEGIPAEYCYKAGDFERLQSELSTLRAATASVQADQRAEAGARILRRSAWKPLPAPPAAPSTNTAPSNAEE